MTQTYMSLYIDVDLHLIVWGWPSGSLCPVRIPPGTLFKKKDVDLYLRPNELGFGSDEDETLRCLATGGLKGVWQQD
ncbi:hypothetical protein LguiB_004043 [Lonicera macranthoides]